MSHHVHFAYLLSDISLTAGQKLDRKSVQILFFSCAFPNINQVILTRRALSQQKHWKIEPADIATILYTGLGDKTPEEVLTHIQEKH